MEKKAMQNEMNENESKKMSGEKKLKNMIEKKKTKKGGNYEWKKEKTKNQVKKKRKKKSNI